MESEVMILKKKCILFVLIVTVGVIGVFFWKWKTEGSGQESREVIVEVAETISPDAEPYIEAYEDKDADETGEEETQGL